MKSFGARLFAISALSALIGTGCPWWGQTDGAGANSHVLNEDMDITTVVYGRAFNEAGEPLKGVTVELLGDKVYTTTTDERGYYRFPEVFIAHAKALIGQGSTANSSTQVGASAGAAAAGSEDDTYVEDQRVDQENDSDLEGNDKRYVETEAYYTILFRHDSLATFRDQVYLYAQAFRTGNSYSYEASPAKYDALLVAFAEFCVKVLLGVDADGSPIGADGAKVTVFPSREDHRSSDDSFEIDDDTGYTSSSFETIASSKMTDVNGKVCYDADDRLAAVPGYMLSVDPYDVNPDDNDGVEYGLAWETIDLTPHNPFDESFHSNYYSQLPEILIDLRNNEGPDLRVAFSQPQSNGLLAPNAPLRWWWSRPVDTSSVSYHVVGCQNDCGANSDAVLLTQELEKTGLTLGFTVIDELAVLFGEFRVYWSARSADGDTSTSGSLDFRLDDTGMPTGVIMPTPMVDVANIADHEQNGNWVADFSSIHVYDGNRLTEETYLGSMGGTEDCTTYPDYSYDDSDSDLDLKWNKVTGARGYHVFVRDSHFLTSWTRINTWEDSTDWMPGDMFRGTIDLDRFYVDQHPYCCGEAFFVAVVPYFDVNNPYNSMPALDPNAILVITDQTGPLVAPHSDSYCSSPDEANTWLCGRDYDEHAHLAFSEYLSAEDSGQPAILADASGVGVFQTSGRFEMDWVSVDPQRPYTRWNLAFSTTEVLADELYIGDDVRDIDGDGTCEVRGLDSCGAETWVYLQGQGCSEAGWWVNLPTYELLGPFQDGGNVERSHSSSNQGDTLLLAGEIENAGDWLYSQGGTLYTLTAGGNDYIVDPSSRTRYGMNHDELTFNNDDIPAGLDLTGATLTNTPSITLSQASVAGDTMLYVNTNQNVTTGFATILDADGNRVELVRIDSVPNTAGQIQVTNTSFPHAAGTTVALYAYGVLRDDAQSGDDRLFFRDPNNVFAATTNRSLYSGVATTLQIGSGATMETINGTGHSGGTASNGDYLDIVNDINSGNGGLAFNHAAGEVVMLMPRSIDVVGSVQRIGNDSGLGTGFEITLTTDCDDCDTPSPMDDNFGVHTYSVCAVYDDHLVFDNTSGMNARIGNDIVFDLNASDVRPGDSLWVGAEDAAGNFKGSAVDCEDGRYWPNY